VISKLFVSNKTDYGYAERNHSLSQRIYETLQDGF